MSVSKDRKRLPKARVIRPIEYQSIRNGTGVILCSRGNRIDQQQQQQQQQQQSKRLQGSFKRLQN